MRVFVLLLIQIIDRSVSRVQQARFLSVLFRQRAFLPANIGTAYVYNVLQ